MSLRRLLQILPSRIALLVGFGALSATGAQAGVEDVDLGGGASRVPQQSVKKFGELTVWLEDGRVFVSESGKPARELLLGDTAEARRLREMLQHDGAAADSPRALQDRIILVGGGGDGFHWAPADGDKSSRTPANPAGAGPKSPDEGRALIPREQVPKRDKTAIRPRSDRG